MNEELQKQAASFVQAAMRTAQGVDTLVRPLVQDRNRAHSKLAGVLDTLIRHDVIESADRSDWQAKLATYEGAVEFIAEYADKVAELTAVTKTAAAKPTTVGSMGAPVSSGSAASAAPAKPSRNRHR